MDKRVWLSRRALKLHAVILVVVPAFMALCVWQITRALGGNSLSWAYVFEWPIFAGYAVYMWWRFVHEAAEDTQPPARPDGHGTTGRGRDPGRGRGAARLKGATSRARTPTSRPTTSTWPSWRNGTRPRGVDGCSGGRARTSNIRLQRPTFCRLNYPGPRRETTRGYARLRPSPGEARR